MKVHAEKSVGFATMNVDKNACVKLASISDFFKNSFCQVLCLQEVDINVASGPSWTAAWQSKGLYAFLGTAGDQAMYRTSLVSSFPGRLVQLDVTDPSRVTAVIFEFASAGGYEKVIVVSLYNYFSDKEAAAVFLEEIVSALEAIGLKWVILGDFNLTAEDPPLARRLAAGMCRLLDEPFLAQGPLPGTAGGVRRLDFGVSSRSVMAQGVWHEPGIANHLAVAYSFDFAAPVGCSSPMRTSLSSETVSTATWMDVWHEEAFQGFLLSHDVDGAWRLLSDTAERVLSSGAGRCCGLRRSGPWAPRGRALRSKAASAFEPLPLVRLRRFARRLGQLARQPADRRLRDIVARDLELLEDHYGWLDELPLLGIEHHVQWVLDQIEVEARIVRDAGFQRWRDAMHNSLPKQSAWIKRRAALKTGPVCSPVAPGAAARTAIHPKSIIEEAEQEWVARWTMGSVDEAPVADLLRKLPEVPSVTTEVQFTADKLRRACARMRHKSPGPDDWMAGHFLALPEPFWQSLAQLWQCCYVCAAIPRRWREAKVSLVPKASGGHRPIAVLAIGYRVGASVLARELRPWTEQWTGLRIMGGFYQRSCRDVFLRVIHASEDPRMTFVGEDISKYFDSLLAPHVRLVLQHLHAPPPFVELVCSVMAEQWRIFTSGGHFGGSWHRTNKGAAQGDPLSPLVAGAVMYVWSTWVAQDSTEAVSFVDDRSFWSPCSLALRSAKRRSAEVDEAFCFRCDARKCQLAAGPSGDGAVVAASFGYDLKDHLELLGVRIPIPRGAPPALARFVFDVAQARVVCSNAVAQGMWQRGFHYRTLVMPMMCWVGAFASIPSDEVTRLCNSILAVTNYRHACDTPAVAVWEVLGWECNPSFARRWSALRDAVRFVCKPPCWLDEAPLSLLSRRWPTLLPLAAQVLEELGWWTFDHGARICRRDGLGALRSFVVGVDNQSVLCDWLRDWHRMAALESTTRVASALHRGEDELACGLLLPGVPRRSLVLLQGHKKVYHSTEDRNLRNSALATGCSVWAKAARCGVPARDMPACACGLRLPSRPHLAWQCEGTHHLRSTGAAPVNRVEERLFAKVVPELPPAPGVVGADVLVDDLSEALDRALASGSVVVGTDGSVVSEVAAWAIAIHEAGVFSLGVVGEDQSSYRAEVEAIRVLLSALRLCKRRGRVIVVCDCQSALLAVEGRGQAAVLAAELLSACVACRSLGFVVEFFWIPSHGKPAPARWLVPPGGEVVARTVNGRADVEARRCAAARCSGSARERCVQARAMAAQWEEAAIRALARIAEHYNTL